MSDSPHGVSNDRPAGAAEGPGHEDRPLEGQRPGLEGASSGEGALQEIVQQEEKVLARVQRTILARSQARPQNDGIDYDAELVALRDQINEARIEDVPPLIEEMERIQQVAIRRAQVVEGVVDSGSPYFGRLVLEEDLKKREVLIGKSTFLDPKTGVRIVDWRDAPVSRIYYRYDEGDDYEEVFGGREVEGEVLIRRSLSISQGALRRIGSPQGVFVQRGDSRWVRLDEGAARLRGGQGVAMRAEKHKPPSGPRRLGTGLDGARSDDKHLPEIAALIDSRQFELITQPSSGLVVIQGGAGSGKTTIGLHRLAYLAFQEPNRFRADKLLVIVFNDALARYISRVLPSLGVPGVLVTTYERWAHRLRRQHLSGLPNTYEEDTPVSVIKLKKSPAMLRLIESYARRINGEITDKVGGVIEAQGPACSTLLGAFRSTEKEAPGHRLRVLRRWLQEGKAGAAPIPLASRHAIERAADGFREKVGDLVAIWAELLTDRPALQAALTVGDKSAIDDDDFREAFAWCNQRCSAMLAQRERQENHDAEPADDEDDRSVGIDGAAEEELVQLDREDDTLLLRIGQSLTGRLGVKRDALRYAHVFVDEAQDLSPVEMSIVLGTCDEKQSVTLAGDVAQRLHMDNGFTDWKSVLADLGLSTVEVEPLRLSYRSTRPIIEFAEEVLGPLRNEQPGVATRDGVPVELFSFTHSGDAVGFLGEAMRELVQAEPLASIAVISRYPEQAEIYFRGFRQAEVPNVRLVAAQDFSFRAGIDVTDVRQVKGLEFDYVVLLEASAASYPDSATARHLMHIAATRAAHQLWVTTVGAPSTLLPELLIKRSV